MKDMKIDRQSKEETSSGGCWTCSGSCRSASVMAKSYGSIASANKRKGSPCQQDGSIASANKRKGSPCQQDGDSSFLKQNGDSQAGKTKIFSIPHLPEDIWHHIHSLMPLRDAPRVACLSRAFLHSWRCYPNLTFNEYVFSPEAPIYGRDLSNAIDCIMRNHSGIGVKVLKLQSCYTSSRNLNRWLRVAIKPGIEELNLWLSRKECEFPCSLLSDGVRNSIRYLELGLCTFRPTAELGPLRCLTSLHLSQVRITGDELECLLSNSLALEKLDLSQCNGIICLRIPCALQRFSHLTIFMCVRLKLIECKAPNLVSLEFSGKPAELSLGEALQMRNLSMYDSNVVCYARTELPSIVPNLETLDLCSGDEVVKTPMLPTKFPCLKHLTICLTPGGSFPWSYVYFSLVSFLDASPSLETLSLDVPTKPMKDELVSGRHSLDLRQMAEDQHRYLKNVKITGFSSAKSLIELTCYIVKNAVSLECLTLDTHYGSTTRCSDVGNEFKQCIPVGNSVRVKRRALAAIRKFIEEKVPAGVKLTVVEPCLQCH